MALKLQQSEYPESLSQNGWHLPTDYSKTSSRFTRELVAYIINCVPDAARILDLNAGEGEVGVALKALGCEYIALEQNPALRAIMMDKGLESRSWRIPTSGLPPESFDLIISKSFLEHVPGWIAAFEVLLEAKRLLKPNGAILIIAPNAPAAGRAFWNDYKQGWYVSKQRLVDMGSDAGLRCTDARYTWGWITLSRAPQFVLLRFLSRSIMAVLNITWFARFLEVIGLAGLVRKVQKTLLEQVFVRLSKSGEIIYSKDIKK